MTEATATSAGEVLAGGLAGTVDRLIACKIKFWHKWMKAKLMPQEVVAEKILEEGYTLRHIRLPYQTTQGEQCDVHIVELERGHPALKLSIPSAIVNDAKTLRLKHNDKVARRNFARINTEEEFFDVYYGRKETGYFLVRIAEALFPGNEHWRYE
mgnify:CR=1 FL=1